MRNAQKNHHNPLFSSLCYEAVYLAAMVHAYYLGYHGFYILCDRSDQISSFVPYRTCTITKYVYLKIVVELKIVFFGTLSNDKTEPKICLQEKCVFVSYSLFSQIVLYLTACHFFYPVNG